MFFRKLFGGDAASLEKKAEKLFAHGDFGGALLSFEKAAERQSGEKQTDLKARVDTCKDRIALVQLKEARRLIAQGDGEMAEEELASAAEVVVGDEARAEIQAFIDSLQSQDAQERATVVEITDEERWVLIAGSWTTVQSAELEGLGKPLREGVLALYDDRASEALEVFETLADSSDSPRFIWLEVARARLLLKDDAGGKEALEAYLDATGAEEVDQAWLGSQIALANIADREGDFEGAIARFTAAINAFDDDPRPYFAMGTFFLEKDLPEEAVDMLEEASQIGDADQPDWNIMQELGLAYRAAKRPHDAITSLENVVSFLTDRDHMDFPPRTVVALAELHEETGKPERAADLWAALTRGSDKKNHARYHHEASRVLAQLGLDVEAARMKKRALALESSVSVQEEE